MRRLIKQISILLIAFVIVIGVVSTTQSQSSDNSNPALFAGHEIAPSAITWSGTGHFVQELLGYIPSGYTVQPNFRQASTSTATANSTISSSDVADLFVNFDFNTGGKSVYLVYTTNGSAPNKSNGTVVNAVFSNDWPPNRTWRAAVPTQAAGTVVNYVFYISDNSLANGWGRISGTNVDRNASQYQTGWSETDNAYFTYTVMSGSPTPIAVTDAKALWLDQAIIGWNGTAGSSYKLLYDPDGGVASNAETTVCTFPNPATACYVDLTASGTVSGYPKNPNATGLTRLLLPGSVTTADVKQLLKGQVVVASYNSGGTRLDATRAQIQSVLDALYAANAKTAPLGVTYSGSVPTLKLWAPTAESVTVRRFADATTTTFTTHPMALDDASGVWTVTGDGSWDRHYYLLDVELYVPSEDQIVHNVVSDPYAITLSADSADTADPRSQFVNLDDADLKPTGWDSLSKPALAAPEDIVVYEVHIRDFSINDATVTNSAERGTYRAFTYDGTGPNSNTTLSDGMDHLLQLQEAGLTHVHLLPTFDIASVPEDSVPRSVTPNPTGFGRSAQDQQTAVDGARATDGFNWGYDPYHYGAPEGSYSTNSADGTQRILEFREMVQALNQNDLRVVMDVVYNHTAAAGQDDKSVLDKIVPGYYYRYDTNGNAYNSSCCADTAAEYEMMEDLMIDTLVRWATAYKVDGFRFDLMNLHTRQNAINAQAAVQAVDPDIYVYGEGWDFGSALAKGLTTCPDCYAKQSNMAGTGIGTFNDRLRDAAHGGYDTDSTQIRRQGFTNGLSYDWNGYCYNNRELSDLYAKTDILRSALRGSGTDWNGQGNPYTDDPQESVPYVSKHDNETLFDQNVFKLPGGDGSGLPGWCGTGIPFTSMSDRVRVQNLGLDVVALAQGIPFFHMGSDILRSKSLDRNSYDSSDWFNRVDWSYNDATYSNNFGQGLPPNWDNSSRWTIMTPLLNNTGFDPASADAQAGAAHLREMLRIRQSSPLFRLQTEADVNARVTFLNADNDPAGVIVMALSDEPLPDLDASYETILVFINADKSAHAIVVDGANGFALHPVHVDAVDADVVVQSADFNETTDTFTIPARTTAVFVSSETIELPSTIDWVGKLYPRGGVANYIDEGSFTPSGFDVYVRVYEPGVTEPAGAPTGIACTLHWGIGGGVWSDLPMTWNAQQGNDDEFKATIPQATINALSPGNYGFTAFCQKSGETGKKWKVDEYDIDGNPADDDQGDGLITIVPSADSSPEQSGSVFVHLFEWRWADIEKECTYLAEKGYRAVQVSPPNEHLVPTADQGGQVDSDFPWWARYQPVTHDTAAFTSRSGTLAEFQSMVTTCNNLGVGIIVDAVINHTADVEVGSPPTGTAGTQYESSAIGRFYGTQYQSDDFHTDCSISSYADREQVQRCKLSGLPDLNTGKSDVQTELHTYLQALINMGVAGFRIDGSKHIAAHEIATILDGLTGDFTVFQEVIDLDPSERVRDWEYTPNGDVTEFAWSLAMGDKFNQCSGSISDLATLPYGNMMQSRFAVTFVDNHDNQRGHGPGGSCVVDHRDGAVYDLATVFTLAYPYGYPKVMSSYYWSNDPGSNAGDSLGPPSAEPPHSTGLSGNTRPVYGAGQVAGDAPANCAGSYENGKWVCEHRRTAIANMVLFRQATVGEPVSHWQTIDSNHIAFGRNDKGFVAINRNGSAATNTYTTGMAQGNYCDIIHFDFLPGTGQCVLPGTTTDVAPGDLITVNGSGQIVGETVGGMDAFAIHAATRLATDMSSGPATYGLAWHYESGLHLGPIFRANDGVVQTGNWTAGVDGGQISVTTTGGDGSDTLYGWIDLNCDGDYDDTVDSVSENVIADVNVVASPQAFTFDLPATFFDAGAPCEGESVHGRFRLVDVQALRSASSPTGGADSGEVEDYAWDIATLPVVLSFVSAERTDVGATIHWQTATEAGTVGFNVYSQLADGTLLKLSERMVLATGIATVQPQDYVLKLPVFVGDTFYIEDVGLRGETRRHGPFVIGTATGRPVSLTPVDWAAASAEQQHYSAERTTAAMAAVQPRAVAAATAPEATAGQNNLVNLEVDTYGIQRLTHADLLAAGLDLTGLRLNRLALTHEGQPVPFTLLGGNIGNADTTIQFVGAPRESLYSRTNIYTLSVSRTDALRIPTARGTVPPVDPEPYYLATTTIEDDNAYSFLAPSADPWYDTWMMAYGGDFSQEFVLPVDQLAAGGPNAVLHLDLFGLTDWQIDGDDHYLQVWFNDILLVEEQFDGLVNHPIDITLPPGLLLEGDNVLKLVIPEPIDPQVLWDIILLNSYGITYPRSFVAVEDALTFTALGQAFEVVGLSDPTPNIYRAEPDGVFAVRRMQATDSGDGTWRVKFRGSVEEATYLVATDDAVTVPALSSIEPYSDITSGSADYLIVSHGSFSDSLAPLVQFHQNNGLSVKVVDTADIYAQFGYGHFEPQAIRDYIAHAITHMGVQYVLLVGGDTYDYFDNLGLGSISFVPSLYGPTEPYVTFAPLDPLYVDVDGDGVPDAPIGRFPVRTSAELDNLIAKTLAYAGQSDQSILLAADDGFRAASASFEALVPSGWDVTTAYLDDGDVAAARQTVLDTLNGTVRLTSFLGHSGPTTWTFDGLFNATDAANLTNTVPTVVTQWGCWNTYHVDPAYNTLAHTFMLNEGGGAAAVLGAATLTLASSDKVLGSEVLSRAVVPGLALGDAVQQAKEAIAYTGLEDVILGWTLLGDPALIVEPGN